MERIFSVVEFRFLVYNQILCVGYAEKRHETLPGIFGSQQMNNEKVRQHTGMTRLLAADELKRLRPL